MPKAALRGLDPSLATVAALRLGFEMRKARLVIEIDGDGHHRAKRRDAALAECG